ncbi:MAG: thylakoid-associated protein [Snowella sp.]|nr:thylakoid-associated protein [Snowella sp.]
MSNNAAANLLQKGLRITIGATTTLVETLQDPQKRQQTLTELQSQLSQQIQLWAEKGEITETEAKRWVETWLAHQKQQRTHTSSSSSNSTDVTNIRFSDAQREIEELTAQILALKTELEQSRSQSGS